MIPSQRIARTAFDLFIFFYSFSARQRSRFFFTETEPQLTLCGSTQGYCAGACKKGKKNLCANTTKPMNLPNKNVTELLPTRCADGAFIR